MIALMLLFAAGASATDNVVWQGSKKFTNWGDVVNIDGSKLKDAKADDVLRLSITASNGAQLQLSWGNSWTNFEGLDALGISGDYDMLLTSQNANRLHQGLHIKGVNFTLTAVTLVNNEGEYSTLSEDLFSWDAMLLSGATQGQTCILGLKAYGGAGWYWQEPVDLSGYGNIVVDLQQPAAESMMVQLLFSETGVMRRTIAKGATQCKLSLSSAHNKAYSLNIISEKAQTVSLGSVNLTDKQGNVVSTGVENVIADGIVVSTEYYNTAGVRLKGPQKGVNIVKRNYEGGRSIIRKEIR